MTTLAIRLAPPRSRAAARATYQVTCALVGSIFIAFLAQVSVPLPFTPVPITGQTLGVLLVGAAYGPVLGGVTLLLYLSWGAFGLPVFAPNQDGSHSTGIEALRLASPTAGYLWGFVVSSALVGWLSRRGWDRSFRSAIGVMFLGEVVLYAAGVPWLMRAVDVDLETALVLGLYPFVIGDTLKLLAAAGLLPAAWRLMERFGPKEV